MDSAVVDLCGLMVVFAGELVVRRTTGLENLTVNCCRTKGGQIGSMDDIQDEGS